MRKMGWIERRMPLSLIGWRGWALTMLKESVSKLGGFGPEQDPPIRKLLCNYSIFPPPKVMAEPKPHKEFG